jgi:hypothetical protein
MNGMTAISAQGREVALAALAARRERNVSRTRIDNGALVAGSPMYYDCDGCGGEIVMPELWTQRPRLCLECQALKECGWLGES